VFAVWRQGPAARHELPSDDRADSTDSGCLRHTRGMTATGCVHTVVLGSWLAISWL